MSKRIVFIGAAGEMNREAIKRVVAYEKDVDLHLTDINETAVKQLAEDPPGMGRGRVPGCLASPNADGWRLT